MKASHDDTAEARQKGCLLLLLVSPLFLVVAHLCLTYLPNRDDAALTVIRNAGGRLDYQRTPRLLGLSTVTDTPLYAHGDVWDINLRDIELNSDVSKSLASLSSLYNLDLYHCRIPTGTSTSLIPTSRELKMVSISGTNVGDAQIKTLDACPNLWLLALEGTVVTDASVPVIVRCRKLNVFYLRKNKFSETGIAAIRKAFPKATIEFE